MLSPVKVYNKKKSVVNIFLLLFDIFILLFDLAFIPRFDLIFHLEGLQTMRNLGRNMAFLIRAIAAEKEKSGMPAQETDIFTSFPDGL